MSLHALAGHMASKGRGSDSMLVHMTPEEVQSLQVLALKGGGTLTINPDTGLPEANFLKKMLPMIAGFALGPAGFGLMSAGMAGAAVGGITALSTGSLSRGLMAGLGAYGGASLGGSLAGAGAGTSAANAAALGVEGAATGIGSQAAMLAEQTAGFGAEGLSSLADSARVAVGAAPSKAGMLSAGFDAVTKSPEALGKFAKSNYGALAAAVSPMMAADTVQTTTKRPDTGTIRNFTFDPYGQTYSDAGSYPASEYKGMAQGGIVALAAGGLTPEQARQMVEAQYATIGRTGVGTGANQIDQSGLQGWTDALVRGDFKAADLGSRFGSAVTDYMAQNPNDQYTQYVTQFKANQPAAAQPAAAGFTPFNASQINNYIADNSLDATGIAAATKQFNVDPNAVINAQNAQESVSNVYRNVLGRDPDPVGLEYWSNKITSGQSTGQEMYNEFLKSAQSVLGTAGAKEIFRPGISLEDAVKPFAGYSSADKRNIADEWVRNTLGREVTDADRSQQWYKDATNASSMSTYDAAQDIFGNFQNYARTAGQNANLGLGLFQASQLNPLAQPRTTPATYAPEGTTNPYGNAINPGDQTRNADGSITVQPNIPGRPYGGFTGMGQVRDAYTQGGGSLGYTNAAPKTMEEFDQRFNKQTGDSLAAYNYLMGKGANPIKSGVGEIMRPYSEAVLGIPVEKDAAGVELRSNQKYIFQNGKYVENPNYRPLSYNSKGERMVGLTSSEVIKGIQGLKDPKDDGALFDFVTDNRISEAQLAAALGISIAEARARIAAGKKIKGITTTAQGYDYGGGGGGDSGSAGASGDGSSGSSGTAGDAAAAAAADGAAADGPGTGAGWAYGGEIRRMALGGLGALAGGGSASQYNLGGYSDGGRLLRGPGDGVSDSIPATIGGKQPARLADGEFVVPARIVSELGNGSTEAGARKLYAMMDRVQKARGKTTGKNRVAANTRSDKYLPA